MERAKNPRPSAFVGIVSVEGGAANSGAIEDFLHGDFFEGFLVHELDKGVAEGVASAKNAAVGFCCLGSW